MSSLLFLLCYFISTIAWDITSKLYHLVRPKNRLEFWNKFLKTTCHKALFLARFYARLNFQVESDIKTKLPNKFIIVSNHQSLADIVILVCTFPDHDLKFAAKRELKWGIPAVSVILRNGQHAFLQRKGGFKRTKNHLIRLAISKGKSACPVVFAEGTRSRTGELNKFHSAGLRILLEHSNLPVVAVAVDGGYKISTAKELFTKLKGLLYQVKILKIYPHVKGKHDIQVLLDTIQDDIARQLKKWRKK
ncbi:MAG: 1-acyl-sn-glycerol-3-phosphate acyltransferase [Spirochaetales bacterium]|nr:1-acyl-sn-glycerol-3-phosphate acyltransferase [Spirochaetales bacterium]